MGHNGSEHKMRKHVRHKTLLKKSHYNSYDLICITNGDTFNVDMITNSSHVRNDIDRTTNLSAAATESSASKHRGFTPDGAKRVRCFTTGVT